MSRADLEAIASDLEWCLNTVYEAKATTDDQRCVEMLLTGAKRTKAAATAICDAAEAILPPVVGIPVEHFPDPNAAPVAPAKPTSKAKRKPKGRRLGKVKR